MMPPLEPFPNLVAMFFTRATERGDAPFLWQKKAGGWASTSWRDAAQTVANLAASLRRLGLARGDRVVLVSENRPEWCLADLGIMAAGGVSVPAYTSNTIGDHAHILTNTGARFAIVSTAKLAAPLVAAMRDTPECRTLIAIEPVGTVDGITVHDWSTLATARADIDEATAAVDLGRDDLACIIHTSGTGGAPRGVRHHHGAILHNVAATRAIIGDDFAWQGRDGIFLSLLPLSHAYEHSAGQFLPIGLGGQIYYAESIEKLAANMAEVRPDIMIVVPRLFEVLRLRITKAIRQEGKLAHWLLDRALAIGPQPKPWQRPLDWLIGLTLRPKVRARFGGRLMALVAGGAPLNTEVGRFFESLGLTILQGYGQTEAGPVISCNRPRAGIALETVGPPLDGVTLHIAEDGEILVRGENVMHGYWNDEAETAKVLRDGWLATGDIGRLDAAGRLLITDRKKDLIVNDKGDNVAPQRVEGMLTLEPEIGQAMVGGDRRPYLVGLIVPDAEWLAGWAKAAGLTTEQALRDPTLERALMAAVDRLNGKLSVIEKVRRIIVAEDAFTIANGELTPSLKIRRHKIRERYGARLDALYKA